MRPAVSAVLAFGFTLLLAALTTQGVDVDIVDGISTIAGDIGEEAVDGITTVVNEIAETVEASMVE